MNTENAIKALQQAMNVALDAMEWLSMDERAKAAPDILRARALLEQVEEELADEPPPLRTLSRD